MIETKNDLKLMTIAFVLLFILPCIGLSCGPKDKLVGTWTAQTGCGPVQFTFDKDGTGSSTGSLGSDTFQWRVEGDELAIKTISSYSGISGSHSSSGREERIRFKLEKNSLTFHTPEGQSLTFYRQR